MIQLRKCGQQKVINGDYTWKNPGFAQGPSHPVCGVNWYDAKVFCDWLTKKERAECAIESAYQYRLPTDAEWSIAVGLENEVGGTPMEKYFHGKGNYALTNRWPPTGNGIYPWGNQWPPTGKVDNYAGNEARDDDRPSDSWSNWVEEKELQQKAIHDSLLFKMLNQPPYKYSWGEVQSVYDARSGGSSIIISYHH